MRSSTWRLEDLRTTIFNLGFVGENEHRQLRFDCKEAFDEYPTASPSLTVSPPEGESYPAVIERDGNFILWTITDSDVVHEGSGEFQIAFTVSETVAKRDIGRFKVNRSIVPTGEIPEGIDDFLTRAGAALTAIPETIDEALAEAKASGEFDGPAGPAGQDGADGYSPTATVSKSGKTATITITDKNGTTTAQISDGEGGGTSDYSDLENKPQIAGVTLSGNVSLHDLGAAAESDIPDPTSIIDDTAGDGVTDKTWSADKLNDVKSEIHSASNAVKRIDNLDFNLLDGQVWEMGSFSPSSSDVESNNKIRSGYIQIDGCSQIILSCDTGYRFYGLLYDENKAVISGSEFGWTTTDKYVINLTSNFQTAKYVRIAFQTTDQTASVGIESHMHGIYYDAFVNNLYRQFLLSDTIYGTTQAVTKDSSGKVTQITHSKNNTVIRTDAITYGNGTITEVRTGFNLTVTITTNLSTLAVEVA